MQKNGKISQDPKILKSLKLIKAQTVFSSVHSRVTFKARLKFKKSNKTLFP